MLLWYLGFACSLDIANAVSAAAFLISPVSLTLLASRCGIDWEITLNALPHTFALYKLKSVFFLFIVLLLEKHIATTQIEISSFLFIVLLLGKRIPFTFWLIRLTILKKHLGVLFFPK